MKDGSRLTVHVRAGMRAHVRAQRCLGGGGVADPPERRPGSCYLLLISPALGGFPAVTGLRVETGTNEQLHPACPPGIMGLQTVRVCASFLHFLFAPFAFSLVSHRCIPPTSFFFLTPCVYQIISLVRVNPTLSSVCLDKTIQHAVELWLS